MYVTEMPCPGCENAIIGFRVGLVRHLPVQNIGKFKAPV